MLFTPHRVNGNRATPLCLGVAGQTRIEALTGYAAETARDLLMENHLTVV